jgi:hypothetical protein
MSQEMAAPVDLQHASPKGLGRAFRWIWGGQAISLTCTQLSSVSFQIIAVSVLHAHANQMGLLVAAQTFHSSRTSRMSMRWKYRRPCWR